jgi:hypothetical protein
MVSNYALCGYCNRLVPWEDGVFSRHDDGQGNCLGSGEPIPNYKDKPSCFTKVNGQYEVLDKD